MYFKAKSIVHINDIKKATSLPDEAINPGRSTCFLSPEPIDVVFTWVNGSDPEFIKNLAEFSNKKAGADSRRFYGKIIRDNPIKSN